MKRRPFLHLAVGALATSGCLGAPDPADDSPAADATGTETEATGTETDATTEMAATDGESVAVERVETSEYVVRLNDLGGDPSGGVAPFGELDDREREVASAALDGGYETDDTPEWLVRFASSTPYLERDGTYYRLDHTFPTTTVTAEVVAESDVDGEIASAEEYEAAVTHDGRVMSSLLRLARREGVDLTYVWDSLRDFLDGYDAVRYRGDLLGLSVSVSDAEPPHRLTGTETTASEAVGGEVWDATDADEETRDLVREAGATPGAYGFDRAPSGLFEKLDDHQYVYLDGTYYTASVEKREPVPVSLSADFEGESVRIALRNEASREIRISSGAPRPFGVVRVHPVGDPDDRRLLWTDAYEESDHVHTDGRDIRSVNDIGVLTTLAPGDTVSETYEVPVAGLSSGEYAVEESVGVEVGDDTSTLPYRVVFRVN